MNKVFNIKHILRVGTALVLMMSMLACGDKTDDFKEKLEIQNEDAIEKQNSNDAYRADSLQKSIDRLRNFVEALEGEYTGTFKTGNSVFNSRITFTSSFPSYNSDHIKSLSELEYELQNLNLNIKAISWSDDGLYSGGCSFPNVRPDIENGFIRAFSEECPVDYFIYLNDGTNSVVGEKEVAKKLAQKIKNTNDSQIKLLSISRASIHTPTVSKFYVYRSE